MCADKEIMQSRPSPGHLTITPKGRNPEVPPSGGSDQMVNSQGTRGSKVPSVHSASHQSNHQIITILSMLKREFSFISIHITISFKLSNIIIPKAFQNRMGI